jgi:hypothetical protein|tara:strand:+ start:644 stop:1159 length:516 start_codon:yes stop_codon:yes gene_type:complete
MSTISIKELSHPAGEVIKIAAGKTLDLHSQGTTKMPAGSVLQVITDTYYHVTAHSSTTSTSYVDTELSVVITPKFTNSKIIISAQLSAQTPNASRGQIQILRDSTALTGPAWGGVTGSYMWVDISGTWIDTPSTASSVTYKVQAACNTSGSTFYYHHGGFTNSLVVTEIAQ